MTKELEATDESWELACKIVLGNLGPNTAARKIDEAITAAEARGRVEGARLGRNACVRKAEDCGFDLLGKELRALDPAQIAGGSEQP